ncbi:hypothetical protein CK489_38535 [Bradyrhizobium sp. UFLA03-84]|nr:hypothetical protein CK489_38535 [Bradyrhizobium sp. UFLA03-84]
MLKANIETLRARHTLADHFEDLFEGGCHFFPEIFATFSHETLPLFPIAYCAANDHEQDSLGRILAVMRPNRSLLVSRE